jgi:proliferating cell nuclear antigen PCNA
MAEFKVIDSTKAEKLIFMLKNINIISNQITIYFKKTGIYCQGMDPSQVCLFEFTIDSDGEHKWFEYYKLVNDNEINIGLNCVILSKILNTYKKNQTISFKIDPSNNDVLNINFNFIEEKANTIYDKEFQIPLMDINEEILNIPEKEYAVDIEIQSKIFDKLCGEFALFDEMLHIKCSEQKIEMTASGTEGKMKVKINVDDLDEFSIEEDLVYKDSFSLLYFNHMCTFHKLADTMLLNFENERPMKLTYAIADGFVLKFYMGAKATD